MTSRLRRMLLINTRTSGTQSSIAINELDPTGGAAVTGDNAVGKTTTLEIIPLFFGSSPSQITETAGGREPMLRFLLPHADSAIVFEYQRGSDPERDLRCSVLRRQGASDAPEYRILPCGFNAGFFVRDAEQGQVCNNDEEMVNAMIEMGMRPSPKLAINDYKHIILGTNSASQQAGKLRLLASEHSLAQRALPHLDRLIASVVKQEVNFNDFVRVAVTIVQDKLGTAGRGQDRARFTLRQSRSQIEQWISNREGCERALALDPEVERMRQSLTTCDRLSDQLREAKSAVPPMLVLARTRMEQAGSALKRLQERRSAQLERENIRTTELEASSSEAKKLVININQEVHTEEAVRENLHLGEILQWAADLESLPNLRSQLRNTNELIDLATGQAKDIAERFDQILRDLQGEREKRRQGLGQQETDLQTQYSREIGQIADTTGEQREALYPKQKEERKALADQREQLSALIATAKAQAANAVASVETQEALEIAKATVDEHESHLDTAREANERASDEAQSAKDAYIQAELFDETAKSALSAASLRLEQARNLLAPADGTLLSALRAHSGHDWKTNLARVISPSLLHRTDLQATKIDPIGQDLLLYGWHLETNAIDTPEWADDDQLRTRIELESRSVELAQEAATKSHASLRDASQRVSHAQTAANIAKSTLQLAQSNKRRLKDELSLAQTRHRTEIEAAANLAKTEASTLEEQMRGLDLRSSQLATRHVDQIAQIEDQGRQQRKQAQERRDTALNRINDQRTSTDKEFQTRHQQIEEQRQRQLSEVGVDTERLQELKNEAKDIAETIETTEDRASTVSRWRNWIDDGGHARLSNLLARKEIASQQAQQAEVDLQAHRSGIEDSYCAYSTNLTTIEEEVNRSQDDVDLLTTLLERLGLKEHSGFALPSSRSPLDLHVHIQRLESEVDEASRGIRTQFVGLRDKLCDAPGPVRDLVEQSLKEVKPDPSGNDSFIGQARRLGTVHREMRRRIVPSINNSANTILESVRQFRVQIQSFETEMRRFNGELQKGLSRVHGFQRLSTVEIHMTTDFSTLGFMKGLDTVDAAAREHIARGSVFSNKTDLPDASVSVALRQLASLLGPDSSLDVNLERHTMLRGSAHIDGKTRTFHNQNDLKHISSTGLSAILLISLLSGMLNMIRGDAEVYMPWVTDEVGKFDVKNFAALVSMLKENRIDPVTASPHLSPVQYRHFGRAYTFQSNGRIARWSNERPRLSKAERKTA